MLRVVVPLRDLRLFRLHVRDARLNRCGKGDSKRCASATAIKTFDLATVFLNDSVGDAQTQACAFSDRLGGKERIEDVVRRLNSRAGVRELEDHARILLRGANGQDSAADLFERVNGVIH